MARAWLACLMWLAAAPSVAATPDAFASLDRCVARLDADLDVGYERIAARCPDLTHALETSGWAAWLPVDWKQPGNDLSAAGLAELHRLAARELATHPTTRTPRVERLGPVLAQLGHPERERAGSWSAFSLWLRTLLGPREGTDAWGPGWPAIGLTEAVIELTARGALAVIVMLAAVIVARELRLAGVCTVLRRPWRVAAARIARPQPSSDLGWHDIEQAPLEQRPRLLLTRLASQLTEQSRLAAARGMTARELTLAARLPDEADRSRLAEVAGVAERLRFADRQPGPEHIAAALERGRELLLRLDAEAPGGRA